MSRHSVRWLTRYGGCNMHQLAAQVSSKCCETTKPVVMYVSYRGTCELPWIFVRDRVTPLVMNKQLQSSLRTHSLTPGSVCMFILMAILNIWHKWRHPNWLTDCCDDIFWDQLVSRVLNTETFNVIQRTCGGRAFSWEPALSRPGERKNTEKIWKNEAEWTGMVETREEEIHGSRRSLHGNNYFDLLQVL